MKIYLDNFRDIQGYQIIQIAVTVLILAFTMWAANQ